MKICNLYLGDYKQFKYTFFDFTNPDTGEPLDKICFIGRNGTGKSILLNVIQGFLNSLGSVNKGFGMVKHFASKIKVDTSEFYVFSTSSINEFFFFKREIEIDERWFSDLISGDSQEIFRKINGRFKDFLIGTATNNRDILDNLILKNNSPDILIYCPSESHQNTILGVSDVPASSLNSALELFRNIPYYHAVADSNVNDFWRNLIYLIKRRESEREDF